MPAENNEFAVSSGGRRFRTGLIKPDKIPVSFAAYPPKKVYELDQIKHLYKQPGRKVATDMYTRRKDQGQKSSCAAYAGTTACEVKRRFDRKEDVEFGPEWTYTQVNGGRDEGALLDDVMHALLGLDPKTRKPKRGYGCCRRKYVPREIHTLEGMSMEQVNAAARDADQFKALNWLKMPHGAHAALWAATISAIATRNPVLMAVHCGNGFFSCDPQGNAKVDQGPGNHAVVGVDLLGVETARSIRDIKIITINSHDDVYGNDGCYLHTYDHMCGPSRYHQHCACVQMRTSKAEKITSLIF